MRESAQVFDRRLSFVAPGWLADALAAKAKEQMTSQNSLLRQALAELVSKKSNEAATGA
jgi:hypothetical protein